MSNHVDDSCPEGPFVQTTKVHDDWYKPTPRVAESLDDLAVGMVVAWKAKGGSWTMPRNPLRDGNDVWERAECVVILADPPAPPAPDWLVPADTMKALREAVEIPGRTLPQPARTRDDAEKAIAAVLFKHRFRRAYRTSGGQRIEDGCECYKFDGNERDHRAHVAPFLADLMGDAPTLADAWDEGYSDAVAGDTCRCHGNPYRVADTEGDR